MEILFHFKGPSMTHGHLWDRLAEASHVEPAV